jgi:hypothetical protein
LFLKNGDRYNGIFSTVSDGRYTIKMAKKLPSQGGHANGIASEQAGTGPDRTLSFNINDVVDLHANDVRFDKSLSRGQNGKNRSVDSLVTMSNLNRRLVKLPHRHRHLARLAWT